MRLLQRPPVDYAIAQFLMRHSVRGGARLMSILRAAGRLKDRAVLHRLDNGEKLYVPLNDSYGWDGLMTSNYESQLMKILHEKIATINGEVTLIDCGADIGLVVASLVHRNKNIVCGFALEPNATSFEILKANTKMLPITVTPLNIALSDFIGTASLQAPIYDQSSQAQYIVVDRAGKVDVLTLDELGIKAMHLVVKIDVEGEELNVIKGGRLTIQAADTVLVAIEAHPVVAERTGIDPIVVLREINGLRPFSFCVAEQESVAIDLSRPFFDQVDLTEGVPVFNVVGISRAG